MGFFVLVQLFICWFVVFWVFFCSNVIWSGESLWNGIKLNSASESAEASSACVLNMLIQSRHSRKAGFNLIYIPITPLCDFMFVCLKLKVLYGYTWKTRFFTQLSYIQNLSRDTFKYKLVSSICVTHSYVFGFFQV